MKKVKKVNYLLVILIMTCFIASCKDDDDSLDKNRIIGKWEWLTSTYPDEPSENFDHENEFFIFNSNGIGYEEEGENMPFNWNISDYELIIKWDDGDELKGTIIELSDTTLKISSDDDGLKCIDIFKKIS